MRRLLVLLTVLLLTAGGGLMAAVPATAGDPVTYPTAEGDPPGANDWDCRPTSKRPVPVVLVHGTFGDRKHLLEKMSATLAGRDYCVYSLDYGNRATQRIQRSARELKKFVNRVRRATGARKVSLVGHSQGGMMPRYYIKFLRGARHVEDLVGIAPSNHGTAIVGDPDNPLTGAATDATCPACRQQAAGSDFLRRLNAGDETPGRVSYTQLVTRYDEVVVPYTSGYLERGRRTTNRALQGRCPTDTSEHLTIPMSDTTIAFTLNALRREGPVAKRFDPCP